MNKKIAIQFYGHIRTYEKCFLSFFENIINPNIEDNYSIDIFIHTWDEFNTITKGVWHNKYNFYPTLSSKKLTSFDIKKIIEIYNPKKIIIDKVLDKHRSLIFEDHHKNATDFSFETVVKMRKEYEKNKSFKYDYILTSRLDIYFFSKFKINTFIDIYKYNSCMRQVPLPEKYILTHIDTTFKVLDIRYPTDAPLFFISNFDIDRLKDLFYKSDTLIIFCDYKKNIDFKILREVDEIYLRDINLTQLPYKLGQVMVTNSKSLLGYIKMPFMLFFITYKHNKEEKIYQEKIKKDPSSKLQPLEFYIDYKEALKEKECFTYKLGEEFIKSSKNWYWGGYIKFIFKDVPRLKREYNKN